MPTIRLIMAGLLAAGLMASCGGDPSPPLTGDPPPVPSDPSPDPSDPPPGPGDPPPGGFDAEVSVPIGPAGGTVATPGGAVTLVVPPGALAEEVVITIEGDPDTTHPWGTDATFYRLGPSGLAFATSATLTFAAPELVAALPDPAGGLAVHAVHDDEWIELASVVDTEAGTVSADIDGFSRFGARRVAPRLRLILGGGPTLVPVYSASLRANSCQNVACSVVEDEEVTTPDTPHPFVVSDATCDFRTADFLNWLVFGHHQWLPGLAGETGTIDADVSLELHNFETAPHRGVGFSYELEAAAEPVLRVGRNTTGTVFTQLSFLRLDDDVDLDRRLLLDVDNPGRVEFDLRIEWRATGAAAGNRPVYSAASAEMKLLRCGEAWEDGAFLPLFSEIAATAPGFPPVTEDAFNVTGSDSFDAIADARVQLWIGFDAHLQATSIRGDEEGTVGYGAREGSEAFASGALVVRVEPP